MEFKCFGWRNSMAESYKNKQFNKYEEGPGGDLNEDSQPGAIASSGKSVTVAVYLKNVPTELDDMGISNLCKQFGTILDMKRFPTAAIVVFPNLSQAEQVMRGINDEKSINIHASFALNYNTKTQNSQNKQITSQDNQSRNYSNERIFMDNRRIKGPFNRPNKINTLIQNNSLVANKEDYQDTRLRQSDPHMDFCGASANKFRNGPIMNSNNVTNGRATYSESEEFLNKMKALSSSNSGDYDEAKSSSFETPELGTCLLCNKYTDKTCERCGEFYCSLQCQKKDWPKHRPICFPLPRLVSSTSSRTNSSISPSLPFPSLEGTVTPETCSESQNLPEIPKHQNKQFNKSDGSNIQNQDKPFYKSSHHSTQHQNKQFDNSNRNNVQNQNKQFDKSNQFTTKTQHNNSDRNNMPNQNKQFQKTDKVGKYENKQFDKRYHVNNNKHFNNKTSRTEPNRDRPNPKNNENVQKSPPKNDSLTKQNTAQQLQCPKIEFVESPKSHSNVIITAVIDHRTLYVRSNESEHNAGYIKDLNDFVEYANVAKPLINMPDKGQIVLAEFEGYLYRAIVLKPIDVNYISVAFVDFGNVEQKTLNDLKDLRPDLQVRKRYTYRIVLKEIPVQLVNDDVLIYLHEFVKSAVPLQIVYEGALLSDVTKVDLIDNEKKKSISKHIIQLNTVTTAKINDDPIFIKDIDCSTIDGNNFDVVVLDSSMLFLGHVTCIQLENLHTMHENNKKFHEYCENVKDGYTPRIDEVCLVKYPKDNIWYRAYCIEVAGDGHPSVYFIDYGNTDIISIEHIRKMPKEFAFPCLTVNCFINGIPENPSVQLASRLRELLPTDQLLKVSKSEKTDENSCLFYLPDIIEILKNESLI